MKENALKLNYTNPPSSKSKQRNILNVNFLMKDLSSLKYISPIPKTRCTSKPEIFYNGLSSPKNLNNRLSHISEVQTYKIESSRLSEMTLQNNVRPRNGSKFTGNNIKCGIKAKPTLDNRNSPPNQVKTLVPKLNSPRKDIARPFQYFYLPAFTPKKDLPPKLEKTINNDKKYNKNLISYSATTNTAQNISTSSTRTESKENGHLKTLELNLINFDNYSDSNSENSDVLTTSNLSISSKNCESQFFLSLPEKYQGFAINLADPGNNNDTDFKDCDEFKSSIKTIKYLFKPNMKKTIY